MSWQPNLNWKKAKQRAKVLSQIRLFFGERDIIEVETPLLSQGTVTDVHLDGFTTEYKYLSDSSLEESNKYYLQTSPEFAMKRLISSGYQSIYQICKAFRHEESGSNHNPEFTMVEWYRVGFNHFQLMDEVFDLLEGTLKCQKPEKLSYQEVFKEHLQIDPLETSLAELKMLLSQKNITGDWLECEDDLDILLQVLFTECIEPLLGQYSPCFIYNFPISQASLARASSDDPRVSERFECYYLGVELANGFNELTDAEEQLSRFEQDNEQRIRLGKEAKPIDKNFINALSYGLPQCAGVALGIDRLLMLAMKEKSIHSTLSFSIKNA